MRAEIAVEEAGEVARDVLPTWLEERGAMPVEECVRQIVVAMRARRRDLIMTIQGKVGMWLKLIAPRLVDRMARSALARTRT